IEEAALLASQLKAPTHYSPLFNPERALARRNTIINGMFEAGFITEKEKNTTTQIPILHKIRDVAEDDATYGEAPYFTEFVRQQLEKKQQILGVNIYEDGLTVYTTLDSRLQACAERAIALQLPKVDKRAKTKDSTHVQVAFVALDHKTGEILAMVGGTDFLKTKFNRSVQAVRQPGSVFKSVLYTAAIDNGVPVCYEVLNQPVSILMADGTRWEPHNYEGTAGGLVTLREALKKSLNLVSVRLAVQRVVPPEIIIEYARRLGIQSPIEPYDAIALGATGILPIEAVAAYGTIANQGVYTTPTSIVKIEDKFGKILEQKNTESREALSVETTYLMTNLLEGVVNNGTAASLRSTFNFRRPAAGKTGTTNDFTDAWFIGFIPQMTAGVWVGFDDPKKTLGSGQTGGKVALPIWAEFMKCGCDTLQLSEERFEQPAGIVSVEICSETKELPTPYCQVETEIFNVKYLPQKTCSRHSGTKNKTVRKSGF
ncbi:hypothetical protein IT568_06685, partial [bacterium]|nr:hypothetical protein [bacterium]